MKRTALDWGFGAVAGLLVLFVLLPLTNLVLTLTPQQIGLTLSDIEAFRAIGLTFLAAGCATGLALLTGVPLAYLLARRPLRGRRLINALINAPVIVPHTAAGVALLMVFGRYGLVGRWLKPLGITFTDNFAGIVIAMLFVSLPYLVNMSRDAFAVVDEELEQAAWLDGASAWQTFWRVLFPLARRGIVSGAVMMWARGLSEFGAVVILAYHPKIAPVLVYERFEGFGLAAAQPVAAVLVLLALLLVGALRWWLAEREE